MRAIANMQASLHVYPGLGECRNFRHQRRRIHHRARSDHRLPLRPKNTARNQLQHIAVLADDDRVPRVVAARDTRDVVKRSCKVVDHLAFAFVAPLRAHHHHRFHAILLLDHTSAVQLSLRLYCFGKHQETAGFIVSSPRPQRKQTRNSDLGRVRSFSQTGAKRSSQSERQEVGIGESRRVPAGAQDRNKRPRVR